MHIPENYLSPETCAVLALATLPAIYVSARRIKARLSAQELPLLGVGAALSFLLMMFNIPVPGGTSAHAVGGTLLAALLGPESAVLSMAAALLIQAFFFGDGGILALGANIFNMAVILPLIGYGLFKGLSKLLPKTVALAIGAYVGINAAALAASIEFGIQPILFHDAAGLALYSPYPLAVSIPAMMLPHLTLAGLVEVIFTVGIYSFVHKTTSGETSPRVSIKNKVLYGIMALLIVLCPLGLLTEATAWGEWGTDEIAEVAQNGVALGYVPSGMEDGFQWTTPLADYSFPGMPDVTGYIVSAVIGVAVLVIVFKLLGNVFHANS